MKSFLGIVAACILVPVLLLGLTYGGMYLKVNLMKTFLPAIEDVKTEVRRNTRAYVEGSIRDLRRLQREYDKEDDAGKAALRTIIRQRADELDYDKLPSDVQRFISSL